LRRRNVSPQTQKYLDSIVEALEANQARQERAYEPKEPKASNYTTKAAIAWGRAKGYKLLDRERFDSRTNRHFDLPLAADAMMESDDGIVLIQGAGRYERKVHRDRFEAAGGCERAKRLHARYYYLEFVRESNDPIVEERWA